MLTKFVLKNNALRVATRLFSEGTSGSAASSRPPPPPSQVNADVPGLSEACVHKTSESVGPGVDPNKSGPYKVPEYFCYDSTSYFEAEVEMAKYRCPQPSAVKK